MYYYDKENIESLMQPEFIEETFHCRNPLVEQKRNQAYDFENYGEEGDYCDDYIKDYEKAHMELHGINDEDFDFGDEIETEEELVEETGYRVTKSKTYDRSNSVIKYTKQRANGYCELCEKPAPFHNKNGEPHLEVHHIDWLSRGGTDTIDNTVALCPNCHRKMHSLEAIEDIAILKEKVKTY